MNARKSPRVLVLGLALVIAIVLPSIPAASAAIAADLDRALRAGSNVPPGPADVRKSAALAMPAAPTDDPVAAGATGSSYGGVLTRTNIYPHVQTTLSPAPSEEIAGVPGATDSWWAGVQAQLQRESYTLSPESAGNGEGVSLRGYNRAQGFAIILGSDGLRLSSTDEPEAADHALPGASDAHSRAGGTPPANQGQDGESWSWELRLVGYGYAGDIRPVGQALQATARNNRVEYRYPSEVVEWFLNDERGLEHGFTLPAPPQSEMQNSKSEIILDLALETTLTPQLRPDGQAIDFLYPGRPSTGSGHGVTLLRYSELHVTDAAGRQLPACFELGQSPIESRNPEFRKSNSTVRIVIDTTNAVYPLTVDPLASSPGWTATGENNGDMFGYTLASAGDVNGDGYADAIVGARGYPSGSYRGRAYVYHGSASGLGATPVLTLTGENDNDCFGHSVASAGDVNGDGYADVIVGAYGYPDGNYRGAAYVYHGSPSGLGVTPALTLTGESDYDSFGWSVASAGDANGDGYADAIVGARGYPNASYRGQAYVYHGSASGLGATPALTLTGENDNDYFGHSVASAGDVNGDGYADAVVGAYSYPNGNHRGAAYVYHGSPSGLGATPALTLTGENDWDRFGHSVASAGDVNGDGYADAIVGAYGNDSNRGAVYVYHGSPSGLGAAPALTLTGENTNDCFGRSVASVGDVNGDGYADAIVGAYAYTSFSFRGRVYVYEGSPSGLAATPVTTLTGENDNDCFGRSVASAGDVNGDGYADAIVGAYGYVSNQGRAYAYHGSGAGLAATPALTLTGENDDDRFGVSVASMGDVNGDGYADAIVGALGYPSYSYQGRAYVYHGSPSGLGATPALTLTGENDDDYFGWSVASAGDVNGDGYADAIVGAYGYPSGSEQGRAYVYHGSASGLGATPALTLTGENNNDYFGRSVASAGDVNGDGYADAIVGAPYYLSGQGRAYVYHGSASGLGATPALTLTGGNDGDLIGGSVASAGDVNGDGYADAIVGAYGYPSYSFQGRAYVYHGSASGLGATPVLTLTGETDGDYFGVSVASAGDVNGDGYADGIVGAYYYGSYQGRAYVYHGSASGLGATPVLTLTGENNNDYFGRSVASAGDVNGDGYADGIVGAFGSNEGRVYVYHGSASGLGATPALTLTGENSGDWFGESVASAGDVKGDGYADVIVGAAEYGSGRGRAYVYHGNDGGGRTVLARSIRGDGSGTPVQPWGLSYARDRFEVQMHATDPRGRGRVKLQVEVCPPGTPFGDAACVVHTAAAWTDVTTATSGVTLTAIITGLNGDTLYRWRARVLYAHQTVTAPGITPPPNPVHGPWRRLNGQAVEADLRTYGADMVVVKTANTASAGEGETITYTYLVTNTGGMILSGVVAVDDRLGAVPLGATTLAPGESTTATLTYTVGQEDLPGPLVNTVVVTGTPSVGGVVTAADSATVTLTSNPAIAVSKTASTASAGVGGTITYTYLVTNSGNMILSGVVAVDDRLAAVPLGATTLAPGESTTATLTYTVVEADLPGPLVNTVVVTGTLSVSADVTATGSAAVTLVETHWRVLLPIVFKGYPPLPRAVWPSLRGVWMRPRPL